MYIQTPYLLAMIVAVTKVTSHFLFLKSGPLFLQLTVSDFNEERQDRLALGRLHGLAKSADVGRRRRPKTTGRGRSGREGQAQEDQK